jgi:hypothetical protein
MLIGGAMLENDRAAADGRSVVWREDCGCQTLSGRGGDRAWEEGRSVALFWVAVTIGRRVSLDRPLIFRLNLYSVLHIVRKFLKLPG